MTDPATKPVQITPEHASENPAQYGGMPKLTGRILWICGIALLLAGQFYIHTSEPLPARILLAAGTAVVIIACLGRFRFLPADPEISPRITAALLTIVILAAIPIRLYHLGTVPYGAHNDEIVKGMQVLKFFEGDGFQPFYVANKEFLFFYMLAPFVRYFGVSIIGLRALPFTCGLLTVLFTYLCIRRLWGRSAALLGAGFLAAGLWPGQSSHICERLNAAPLMTAASIFLMLLAIQSRRTAAFLLTGIVMGAGMWTFPTFRLIPWAVLAVMTIAVCAGIVPRRSGTLKVVLTAAAWVAVTSAPLKFRIAETFQVFYSRHGHDFKIAKSPEQILEYVSQLLLSFNVRCVPDMSFTLQDVPLFWWPLGAFFLAGVIYLVMHLPRFDAVVTAGWLGAALLPAVVSEPTVRRLTAAQPLVFALIGLGVWHTVTAFLPRTRGRQRWGLIPAFGVVIAAGIVNYHLFTTRIAPEWRVAREDYWIVEAVTAAFDRFEVHIDWIEEEAELPLRYLTYPETGDLNWFKAEPPAFAVPFQFNPNDDFIYFFRNIPENEPSIPVLQDVYPKGVLVLHQDAAHPRGYYSFTMRRDDLASRRGVTVRACGRSVRLPEFTIDPETLQDLQVSVACGTVTVEGILLVDTHGRYLFNLLAPPGSTARMDGREQELEPVNRSGWNPSFTFDAFLTAGPHILQVQIPAEAFQNRIQLTWQVPDRSGRLPGTGNTWQPVPEAHWLQPPFPESLSRPIPQAAAGFQFSHTGTRQYPHPTGNRTYDLARVESLRDGTFIANCWHYQTMVRLDSVGDIIGEWSANFMNDPYWILRFDFDVGPDGNLYIAGDSRKWLFIASPDGNLLRKVALPETPVAISCHTEETLFILGYQQAYRISATDGTVLNRIGRWGDLSDQYRRPMTLATDPRGNCYIADRAYNRIQVYTPSGRFVRSLPVPGPLEDSFGLTIDPRGNVLVPHFTANRIFCISPDGRMLTGQSDYGFDALNSTVTRHPRYILFPDEKRMWITNGDSLYRFQKVRNSGDLTTGTGVTG